MMSKKKFFEKWKAENPSKRLTKRLVKSLWEDFKRECGINEKPKETIDVVDSEGNENIVNGGNEESEEERDNSVEEVKASEQKIEVDTQAEGIVSNILPKPEKIPSVLDKPLIRQVSKIKPKIQSQVVPQVVRSQEEINMDKEVYDVLSETTHSIMFSLVRFGTKGKIDVSKHASLSPKIERMNKMLSRLVQHYDTERKIATHGLPIAYGGCITEMLAELWIIFEESEEKEKKEGSK